MGRAARDTDKGLSRAAGRLRARLIHAGLVDPHGDDQGEGEDRPQYARTSHPHVVPPLLTRWLLIALAAASPDPRRAPPSVHAVTYPSAFGEPPAMQTRDLRPLPFGYGMGSSTMATWLSRKAEEVYGETADEYTAEE